MQRNPLRLHQPWLLAAIILMAIESSPIGAQGAMPQCDVTKGVCLVADKRLTIGDPVAIINEDREIVAEGVVEKIRGEARVISLTATFGPITQGVRVVRPAANADDVEGAQDLLRYRRAKPRQIGGSLGFGSLQVGESSQGLAATGQARWRRWRFFDFGAGGFFQHIWGTVVRGELNTVRRADLSATALGGSGSVNATPLPRSTVAPIVGADIGLGYVFGSIDSGKEELDAFGFESGLSSGLALSFQGRLGVRVLWEEYSFEVAASYHRLEDAAGTYLLAGVFRDW